MKTTISSRLLSIFSWFATGSVLLGWWFFLAPIQLGGPLAYIRVDGVSMQPVYRTGDLIVASSRVDPELNEIAVFLVEGVPIVHRIVGGDSNSGWRTKGENLDSIDPWTVPTSAVIGVVITVIPGGADFLLLPSKFPLQFGLVFGFGAALTYLPWRRKRFAQELKIALQVAVREPRRDGRTNTDYAILISSCIATLSSLVVTVALYSSKTGFNAAGWASLAGLVISGSFTLVIIYRLYDGRFAKEPAASMFALSGRLYRVQDFPSLRRAPASSKSAVDLRNLAERYRLPILHRIDPVNGEHSFLLILADGSACLWKPARHKASRSAEVLG